VIISGLSPVVQSFTWDAMEKIKEIKIFLKTSNENANITDIIHYT